MQKERLLPRLQIEPNLPLPAPLSPKQLEVIQRFKLPLYQAIAKILVRARSQGKGLSREKLIGAIPPLSTIKPDEMIDEALLLKRAVDGMNKLLKRNGDFLVISTTKVPNPETGKPEFVYCLKTEAEYSSSTDDFRTVLDVLNALQEKYPDREITSQHPSLLIAKLAKKGYIVLLYLDQRMPKRRYFSEEDYWKIVHFLSEKIDNGTLFINSGKNGQKPPPQEISDEGEIIYPEKHGQKKKQHRLPKDPSDDEVYLRSQLSNETSEEIERDVVTRLTEIILSHMATDCMEELTKSPQDLIKSIRSARKNVMQIKRASDLLTEDFPEKLKQLWDNDPRAIVPEREKISIGSCSMLKEKNFTPEKIVEIVLNHFSI